MNISLVRYVRVVSTLIPTKMYKLSLAFTMSEGNSRGTLCTPGAGQVACRECVFRSGHTEQVASLTALRM